MSIVRVFRRKVRRIRRYNKKTFLMRVAGFARRVVGDVGGRLVERGMVTAEYVVGILAAVALALVMLKVFQAGDLVKPITSLVTFIFQKLLGWIPGG